MQGQNLTIVIIAGIVVVLLVLGWLALRKRRTDTLREHFGDEYDRTVETRGGRSAAEAELLEREKRVKSFDIRPLGPAERAEYKDEWVATKALFVDSPIEAVIRADRLLANVMKARGYPMADFEARHAHLTVDHGEVARHYLAGHEIADRSTRGEASTEDLRQAMRHYEALFEELVNEAGGPAAADAPRSVSAPAQARA